MNFYKENIYCLSQVQPALGKSNNINVETFTGIKSTGISQQSGKLTLNTTKGIYVFFHYEGS